MDGGPKFRGPLKKMMEQFQIPHTLILPYKCPRNILAEYHVGITKLLLKKSRDGKTDFQENISHVKNCARQDGYSPAKLFQSQGQNCLIPEVITDTEIVEGMKSREQNTRT